MVYLDTGCLLKLYYPEPESAAVAAAVTGETIVFTALHELEMMTATQLKVFRGEATPEQITSTIRLVRQDVLVGKLVEVPVDWEAVLRDASGLAQTHAAAIGCRSLDILHCALAKAAMTTAFLSFDARQITLARRERLHVPAI